MFIEDGKGSGYLTGVTSENKLRTYATIEDEVSYESETNQQAYTWTNVTYNYSANDTILLVKNTNNTENLIIDLIVISGDTSTTITIHSPNCGTPTGTTVTGTNLNRTSSLTADAIAKSNEATNTQDNIIAIAKINGSNAAILPVQGAIVLGLNDCIAVDFTTDGGAANVTIRGYYHTKQ